MSTKIFAKHIIRIKEAILINNYLDTFIYTPTIFAGTGVPGFNNMWPANPQNPLGDVPLPIAQINHPRGLSADYLGNLYFADEYNGCVRMVTRDDAGAWVIRTIAGDGNEAGSGNPPEDGPAFGMELYEPMDVDVSAHCHYVVFLNTDSHMVHLLEMNHEHEPWIHHIAGIYNPGGGGYVQPGSGLAKEARFKYPQGIAITKDASTIYVADSQNHVIRKLTKVQEGEWMIEPFAGTTAAGYGGDGGHALAAMLYEPIGIALDEAEQNLYIADMRNHRIRKINLLSWLITTVAGNGQMPPNQYTNVNDGTVFELGASLNAVALFKYPSDVAIDANGNLYVADYEHNRIRKIRA
ncbi:MAG: hypothetical protein LBE35_07425, partial [Clostridiales bacterium]|nr:hypothetical protein [Clostridiales bacterium]